MRSIFFLFLFSIISIFSQAQNYRRADSLKLLIVNAGEDSVKARLYQYLITLYEKSKPDSALILINDAINLPRIKKSTPVKNPLDYFWKAYTIKGAGYIHGVFLGHYDTSIVLAKKAEYMFNELLYSKDDKIKYLAKRGLGGCYNIMGCVYDNRGETDKAVEWYLKSVKKFEEINEIRGIGAGYVNLGIAHTGQNNFKQAVFYFEQGLIYKMKGNDEIGAAGCYNNIGGIYYYQKKYDKAREYYLKALKVYQRKKYQRGLASSYVNLGILFKIEKNYLLAIENYMKAKELYVEMADMQKLSVVNNNISSLYLATNQFQKAYDFAMEANITAKQIGNLPDESDSYEKLMNATQGLGKFKEALNYAKLYIVTHDSLMNLDKSKTITEMDVKFQTEKKQQEIEKQQLLLSKSEAEIRQQRIQKLSLIGGLALMFVLVLVVYKNFRDKRKANNLLNEKNNLLEFQKKEIEEKNEELNQQNEEIIAQRDEIDAQRLIVVKQKEQMEIIYSELTSSIHYAKKIQIAVLPGNEHLKSIFRRYEFSEAYFDSFILFKPKDIVSGDFYFAERRKNIILFSVGDCTGHGVPGAFMSMLGIAFLNEIISRVDSKSPGQVLDELRALVIHSLQQKGITGEQKDGMDIAFCALNTETLELQFAGANNPLWVVPSRHGATLQSLNEISPDKQPIGIYENMKPFTNHVMNLQKGDTIYLMSDGYSDQFGGPKQKKFLSKNLKNLLLQNSSKSMDDQKKILENTLAEWIGNGEQIDDITVLGLKV